MQVGLRLADLLREAGSDVVEYRGSIHTMPWHPDLRGPAWAARDTMADAGFATADDLRRWDEAFTAVDAAARRPQRKRRRIAARRPRHRERARSISAAKHLRSGMRTGGSGGGRCR